MRAAVLDSWAVLCYLRGEHDHRRVVDLLTDAAAGKAVLSMSMVNLTEVLYTVERLWGRDKAAEIDNSGVTCSRWAIGKQPVPV